MYPGLIDNANHLSELKSPGCFGVSRAYQGERPSDLHKKAAVSLTDLDLINTSNIRIPDLSPCNKCLGFIIGFSPAFSSGCPCDEAVSLLVLPHTCPFSRLQLSSTMSLGENLTFEPACPLRSWPQPSNQQPNQLSDSNAFFFFFSGEMFPLLELPIWYLFFLSQASHTWSFTSYFTGRIETIWCVLPHLSKTSSPFPFLLLLCSGYNQESSIG